MNSNHNNLESSKTPDIQQYIQQAHDSFAQGDTQGAMANFQNAISLHPQCVELYTARAYFRQHRLRDLSGALEDYTQAIAIEPNHALCYFWRSQIYQELGDQASAIEDYNKAMRLAPEGTIYLQSR